METGSFLRRTIVAGAATMLVVTGGFASVQAQERVTDGWLHSTDGQEARQAASETTDGWLHSVIASKASTRNDLITDGWLHSTVADAPNSNGVDNSVVADSAPVTDGWQHSLIGESARNTAPEIPIAATSSEFPTEIAVGSSLLALTLMAAGIVVLLRRRHNSIAA